MGNKCKKNIIHCSWNFPLLVSIWEKKPNLPNVLNNKLPALEEMHPSKIISNNPKAMKDTQKALVHSESSEKLKRASRHNTRTCNNIKLFCGDNVYYKQNNSKRWKGPCKVLRKDGQQVLIKHVFRQSNM